MRFLLVEDRGDYITNYSRKFADKDHQATVQNLNKKFNNNSEEQEKEIQDNIRNVGNNLPELLKIKVALEKNNQQYDDLQGTQRDDFILKVIERASNRDTLSQARLAVVNAIKNSNWNENIVNYLGSLPNNIKISNPVVELTTNLINDNKIDYNKSKEWLSNRSVYDREEEETLYTIKALTLVDNDTLKQRDGDNIFKKEIKVEDLKEGDKFFNADKIKDILDRETNPDVKITSERTKKSTASKSRVEEDSKELIRGYLTEIGQYNANAEKVINDTFNPNLSLDDNIKNIYKALNLNLEKLE